MEHKPQKTVEATSSILSSTQRSILVWVLGKLSLLLGLALLALVLLCSLELLAATRNAGDGAELTDAETLIVPASIEGKRGGDNLVRRNASSAASKQGFFEPELVPTRSEGAQGDTGSSPGLQVGPLQALSGQLGATMAPQPGVQLEASPTGAALLPSAAATVPPVPDAEMVVEEVGIPTTEATIPAVTLTVSATTTTDAGRLASVLFGDAYHEEETIDFPDRLASTAAVSAETAAGAELAEVLPTSTPAVQALDEPSPPDPDARPVQIRIPAIKVKRSIVELPEIRDPATGAWTQDLDVLFRKGRKDLVGHYMRSAVPGQAGNMILAGHNYGYGTRGVFLKLGRLKEGEEIHIVNAAGEAYTYRVMAVEKVPWRSKDTSELLQHARLLAPSGEERLTLVTCGGSKIQPFPARIYVIAEPVGN